MILANISSIHCKVLVHVSVGMQTTTRYFLKIAILFFYFPLFSIMNLLLIIYYIAVLQLLCLSALKVFLICIFYTKRCPKTGGCLTLK